ncbi:MAG: Proteasome subunit alpha [Candidatus Bathyarchaeota archaeon BA1]|nr:MAG: Proteasome subunit alpha [Candidatus Bathyarchaeota archaeon BA1]
MPEVRVIIPEDLDRALDALIRAGFAGNKAELTRAAITHFLSTIPTQLPKGYDVETAFSPDGRVFQLEYAVEAVRRGGTIVGVCCPEGVVLAKELRKVDPLEITPNPFFKIFELHESIGIVYCGLQTDGYNIVEEAKKQVELLKKEEDEADIETLVKNMVLFIQPFTQRKDVRPLGVALIVGGIDSKNNPRLFLLEGAGGVKENKACAIGLGGEESIGILKGGYKADLRLEEAIGLAIKAALREAKKPENVLVATIDAKTKAFREVTLEEKERMWRQIFP